jgi:hypothetical protein
MNDMASTIIPKSDQLNSDDLIAGPITIKIADVTIRSGQEQPISVHYEGDNGKPYKPCKSMCRVMVTAWGADSKKYIGRSMTLYRDDKVKWAGMEVGGIRISHMSDIDSAITMALTVTRANKKPFTVKPIAQSPAPKAEGTHGPEPARTGEAVSSSVLAQPASSSAPTTEQRIATALEYASDVIKKRFAARLAAAGLKSASELDDAAATKALEWITALIDKEATTT